MNVTDTRIIDQNQPRSSIAQVVSGPVSVYQFSGIVGSYVTLEDHQAELDRITKERDNWKQIVKDQCEADDDFRKVAGAWDASDSYGVEPQTDILERVLKELDRVIGEAVWAMERESRRSIITPASQRARRFLNSPEVQAWRARQKEGV